MTNKSKILRFPKLILAAAGFVCAAGVFTTAQAQQTRDPFEKSPMMKPRVASAPSTATAPGQPKAAKPKPAGPPPVIALGAPPIDQRISYYKRLREDAALNGQEIPKVTSVLTLDEMSVIGIFRTPRGYAAMVQAAPINLSYTIYPGEKFFDGQLVAVEENRLVFRKVIKMSNGKFTAAVENKTLRQYSVQEEVQGTAPVQPSGARTETANNSAAPQQSAPTGSKTTVIVPTIGIISPLEEMLRQPKEEPKDATAKGKKESAKGKKSLAKGKNAGKDKSTVKVADNKKQQ